MIRHDMLDETFGTPGLSPFLACLRYLGGISSSYLIHLEPACIEEPNCAIMIGFVFLLFSLLRSRWLDGCLSAVRPFSVSTCWKALVAHGCAAPLPDVQYEEVIFFPRQSVQVEGFLR